MATASSRLRPGALLRARPRWFGALVQSPSALKEPVPVEPRALLHAHHARILRRAIKGDAVPGNRVEILVDGPQTHAAMFAAIDAACESVNIESYILEDDGPGRELAELLIRKCRAGLAVNLIYDSFGSWSTRRAYFELLGSAGVRLLEFNPINPFRHPIAWSMHLRDHRKLLVVDGRKAFIGGVNISSVYSTHKGAQHGADGQLRHWRDTHLSIEGPVVACLQQLFLDHWRVTAGRDAQTARYFPALGKVGTQQVAVAACSAGRRRNPLYRALLGAIDGARYSVNVTAAYFVPPRRLERALKRAARRGVDVRLALPGISDVWAPLAAGRSSYGRMLRAGVRIYERHNAMLHAKTVVIDGIWTTVGSSNIDWRSLLHNAEANVVVLDTELAKGLDVLFDKDIRESEELDFDRWSARGWRARASEWLARRLEYFL